MSEKKKQVPAVASTGCSALMSCLSIHRRAPPPPRGTVEGAALRPGQDAAGSDNATAEQYWKRVQLLEEEVRRLGKRLGQGEAYRARSSHVPSGAMAKRCISVGHGASDVQEMVKLEGGGYLHEIRRVTGVPWDSLSLQVSRPVVPENATSAPAVLDKMTETRAEELCEFLARMMPIEDIAGRKNPGTVICRSARLNSGDDFLETLLFKAMDKMERLVLEGLKIQMTSTAADSATTNGDGDRRKEATAAGSKDCMVYVVLIQVRDPKEGYVAIGDPMIGLMEAALESKDGKVKLEVQGVHVAGILFSTSRKRTIRGRAAMWSAFFRHCKGSHDGGGDGCRCSHGRSPNRAFQM
ncbi:hypothetical protein GUJ93_ZPchr0002g25070 [Zizania palustris]|uniref:Uncharacterized protein n=1 Tax=Zizania palustris TaxID=103762 RepID=A0A8J5REG9_ZIZPA|nr:hypothetical protein GUJ93_ZPchr0002g25070 [Zizania palustris]